jgi:hypothetical protein
VTARTPVRCAQPQCAELDPIGEVWRDPVAELHAWKATSVERPTRLGREHVQAHDHPYDAARWVRRQHDLFRHEGADEDHERRGNRADVDLARRVTAA